MQCRKKVPGVEPSFLGLVMSQIHLDTPAHRRGEAVAMRHLIANASTVAKPLLFGATSGFACVVARFWLMAPLWGSVAD